MLTTRATRRLDRVGAQIYSLREQAKRDLERTLADIAAIGYRYVEMLGSLDNFGMRPSRLREVLDRNGLRAPSTHINARALDNFERELDDADILGHAYLIVASLPADEPRTLDSYRRWADRLNEAGALARRRNLWIGFHNHADDLSPIDGVVPYDLLLEHTDRTIVRHQLDTGNIAMAGQDPCSYLERFPERFSLFHLKDISRADPATESELGQGVVDFRRLLAAIDDVDEKLFFVEREISPAPLKSMRRAHSYITSLEF